MDDEQRKSLGATIRTLREAKGLSRPQLAEKAGISAEMLAKVEQGRKAPSASSLVGLAKGLGLDAEGLSLKAHEWAALEAQGASAAMLRVSTLGGLSGVSNGAGTVAGAATGAVIGGMLLPVVGGVAGAAVGAVLGRRSQRNQKAIEALLRSQSGLTRTEVEELAAELGVEVPSESDE